MNDTNYSHSGEDEHFLMDLLKEALENLRLLIFGPLAVGLCALGISFAIAPTFTARTVFLPPQQQQSAAVSLLASLGSLGGLAGAATGLKNPADQYVAFLKSNAVTDALIERFKLVQRYEVRFRSEARKSLDAQTRIATGKDGLISIEFDDEDPEFAAQVANAYVSEFRSVLGRLAVTEAQQRRAFFEKQLQLAKTNLLRSETALRATGVSSTTLKSNPAAAVAGVAALKAQVTAQEVKLGSLRGFLSESAPEFQRALGDLSALRVQLDKQERDEPALAPQGNQDYVARFRDFKYHETLFELYAKQYELARVDEAREGSVVQVLDVAQVPDRKSKPKRAIVAMVTTLATGVLLLLFVFARQALRRSQAQAAGEARLQAIRRALRRGMGLKA